LLSAVANGPFTRFPFLEPASFEVGMTFFIFLVPLNFMP
jgi:hypothetical protein